MWGDLLTECIEWCKKFDIRCITLRIEKDKEKEQAENLKFKKALWRENNKEIRAELESLSKVKDIKMSTTKMEQYYLLKINLGKQVYGSDTDAK